jgi:hypothetical protein
MGYSLGCSPLFVWGGIWGANEGQMKILTKNNMKIIIGVTQLKINIYKA